MPKHQKRKVSDVDLPLPITEETAETRDQIKERKGLSTPEVKRFLNDLDAQGILRAKRAPKKVAGMTFCTIVYWIER